MEPTEAATESAPSTTADFATQNIEASESESATPAVEAAPVAETPAVAAAPVELSEAVKFIQQQGHKLRKDDGRDNWVPLRTVEGMLNRYVDQHRSQWDGRYTTLEGEHKSFKQHVEENIIPILKAMDGDTETYLQMLAQHDPRYQRHLTPQEKKEIAVDANDIEPQLVLDKGAEAYTASLKDLRAWDRRQAKREAVAESREMLRPLQERQLQEQASTQDRALYQKQMQDAQTWDGFGALPADGTLTEHQAEVLKVLQDDTAKANAAGTKPRMTLREAHLQVQNQRLSAQAKTLTTDETTLRAKILNDMKTAPTSTAVPRAGSETAKAPGPPSTRDIAQRTMERLERGA